MRKTLMAMLATTLAFGCQPSNEQHSFMSYEEFRAHAFERPDGTFIIDGDLPVENEADLRDIYDRAAANYALRHEDDGVASGSQTLIVHQDGGSDDIWNSSEQQNLTYCVSTTDFGAYYNDVVTAMADAATAWENVANVDFREDCSGTNSSTSVHFPVIAAPASATYVASAFFPYFSNSQRVVDMNIDYLDGTSTLGVWTVTGVMIHELGHVLGFRHEHTRPDAGTCFEDNNWRDVTVYDGSSVMHYPHCNGTQAGDLQITDCDAVGSSTLYGAGPGLGSYGSCEAPVYVSLLDEGGLGASTGGWVYRSVTVPAGATSLVAQITGSNGDADLYVRAGSQPTTTSYDCRPYLNGSNETCTISSPSAGTWHIGIRAYSTFSNVDLSVSYSIPGGGGNPDPEVCDDGIDNDGDGATDCADSDCSSDPACTTPDPEVCDDGTDNDGDGDTDCADSDCSSDPACATPDPEVCGDGIDNDDDGATDCDDIDCSSDPSCQPTGDWTQLWSNDFEGGWGNFNDGGSDARRSVNDSAYANSGSYCARIRDDSSTSVITTDSFSTSGASEIRVEFSYYARSMENGEDFFVEVNTGSGWQVLGNYARGTDFNNDERHNITLDGAISGSGSTQLRFRNDASGNSDWVYIDDVAVSTR